MYSHQPQQQSNLSQSLPPTPSQPHPSVLHETDEVPDDYFGESEDVPLPFPIQTIVADPQTNLSLTLISALGAGSYAVVYMAREVASGKLYALKCLGKDKLTEEEVAVQRNEVVIHMSLPKHQNIVHLFNMFETTNHLFLLLEYSSGMDMYQWISMRSDKADPVSGEPYSPKTRYSVIKTLFDQVLEGVDLVHACGVAHRDLKPENFLIEFADGQYTVKLTDFGLASSDSESDEFECGSKPYMSFECRNGLDTTYDVKMADIWSLGIILINLLYHRCPWSDPCPQESFAFSEFLKSKVDFLQRRFEDMPGPVARWLGLRAFAFVGSNTLKKRRSRPSIEEWKAWMVDFVPRMLGQIDSSLEDEDDYDEREEYREYLELYENDMLGQEVEGDEILDSEDDSEDDDSDNQVVPIAIQPSSLQEKQHLHPDPRRAYASYQAPMDSRMHNSFNSSSMPKFDPSSFYQPTRLRQESWSDALDMEGTEDAEMDFSAPILFEESEEEEDHDHNQESEDDDDSAGLAVALPDDFIDPLPEPSAASSGRQTPSTPTMTHLNFNSEKRQLPAHLRFDLESPGQQSPQETLKWSAGRGSPGLELNDQINTLVFIEPDASRTTADANQNAPAIGGGHAIAASLPSTSHMETAMGPGSNLNKERALLKQQMRKPARNLQDVKAAPFVFPPLKIASALGNPTTDSMQGAALSFSSKERSTPSQAQAPSRLDERSAGQKENLKAPNSTNNKSNLYVIPKRSQLGPWAGSSTGSGPSRQTEANAASAGRNANWRRSHHRGGSWTSIDDVWDSRRNSVTRQHLTDDGVRGSGKWRERLGDKEEGHVGLPPRVENKFRPRYRQGRREFPPQPHSAALPPAPPMPYNGFGGPRSRHQSRSGTVFDNSASSWGGPAAPTNESEGHRPVPREISSKDSPQQQHQEQFQQQNQQQQNQTQQQQQQSKYENSQLRMHSKANPVLSASRLAGQRNKSLVDLRATDATNQPWRQSDTNTAAHTNTPTIIKSWSQAGNGEFGQRKSSLATCPFEQVPFSSSMTNKSRFGDRQASGDSDIPKDNVYHPPHWHERNNSSSSSTHSIRRPSSGYESDFSGWQKHDGAGPLSFPAKNRSDSKGRLSGHHASSSMTSPPLDRKLVQQARQVDAANNWRGAGGPESGRTQQDRSQPQQTGFKMQASDFGNALSPFGFNALPSVALTSIRNEDPSTGSPLMTLTPPTPNVSVKPEFLAEVPTSTEFQPSTAERDRIRESEREGIEAKKIVKPGAMTGLGNMLRGLVAYNKSIKVGGEGVIPGELNANGDRGDDGTQLSETHPSPLSAEERDALDT